MWDDWQRLAQDIRDGVQAQPGRVALAGLAISIGIISLTVLVALLNGLEEKSERMVEEFGVNVLAVVQNKGARSLQDRGLEKRHAQYIQSNLAQCLVAGTRSYSVPTLGTGEQLTVIATDDALQQARQWGLDAGRFLDQRDLRHRERHAVISRRLSQRWNWAVGDVIMLLHTPFTIVGIVNVAAGSFDSESTNIGLNLGDRLVFVPETVRPDWINDWQQPGDEIDSLFVKIPTANDFETTVAGVQRLLSQPDQRLSHVSWVTPSSVIRGIKRMQKTIQLSVGSIAVLCLLLGGTTLTSLMVANVRERVKEIGLRRSLGATDRDIAILFIVESAAVTLVAGMLGTTVAHMLLYFGQAHFAVPLALGGASATIPMATAITLGLLFSWWPTRVACSIAPSEALRND